ncbi:hypothetical protein [Nonomuraea indica]|uniref:Uncharacterized protein n=1 Tax=Nonomuraea indica TaxID=1581193 RepID=A0ABW7ZUY8_9ACTN
MDPAALTSIAGPLALIVITIRYLVACYVRPFGRCRRCKGKRRIPHRIGRGSRYCRRCDGTGLRLRWGRRLLNYARRLHRDGTR